jgi:hypothetical protein
MPIILKTPEAWLREHQRDLYYFEFSADLDDVDSREQQEAALRELLAINFPTTPLELLGPPENSGWLIGGPATLAVDFSLEDVRVFSELCSGQQKPDKKLSTLFKFNWTFVTQC